MIFFTLPYFYENFTINNFLYSLSRTDEHKFKIPVTFNQFSGQFPYCSWNGGINNCKGFLATYQVFNTLYQQAQAPLRLNCANIGLEDFDFEDCMGNAILKANNNSSNLIEISNLEMFDFLKQRYPGYKFIFSKEADLVTPFDENILDALISSNNFELIGIPHRFTKDLDFLRSVKNRSKLEITVNNSCSYKCKDFKECRISEHFFQLDFSQKSIFKSSCIKNNTNFDNLERCIPIEDLVKYTNIGINHFTFEIPFSHDFKAFSFYVQYFIKPEYQYSILTQWEAFVNDRQ